MTTMDAGATPLPGANPAPPAFEETGSGGSAPGNGAAPNLAPEDGITGAAPPPGLCPGPHASKAGEAEAAPDGAEGAGAAEGAAKAGAAGRRRVAGDPVKALLHRHRELCERAVDPLEIAAGLEAHGITDRTATRFRHRDVFSLAEELYARTPRGEHPSGRPTRVPAGARAFRGFGYALLPGAIGLGAAAAGVAWAGVLTAAVTVAALVWPGRSAGPRLAWGPYLLAAAVTGWAVYRHGTALGVGLALAVAPAHLVAETFAAKARARLTGSRALQDFADRARPLFLTAAALFAAAAAGAAALAGAPLRVAVPLALLLFLTRLLLRHGARRAPIAAALAFALVPVPAAVLAGVAGLLVQAVLVLARASAHART